MKNAAALLALAVVLAGCSQPPSTTSPFDGEAALSWVEAIVYDGDSLRVRSPELGGHLDTAAWLAEQMTMEEWTVRFDNFSGADYLELDHGSVARYQNEPYCTEPDRSQLPGLQFSNVFATRQGTGDGHVVIAAHWDAKEEAHGGDGPIPAANDGASGLGVLLQLQRHLAEVPPLPFDLTIAFLDGEDGFEDCHPLAGSLWAARTGSLGNITQFILLDMVGDGNARFLKEGHSVASDKQLMDALWAEGHARGMGDHFPDCTGLRCNIADDHVPFIEEGISAIDLIDAGRPNTFPPYWHTSDDTPDKLSTQMLGHVGELVLWILTDPETQTLLQD